MNYETVILAEKPSQARSYVEAFQESHKKPGYYQVRDPLVGSSVAVTYGFGHLVELASPDYYHKAWKKWRLDNLPLFPEQFEFVVPGDKQKQFVVVKDLLVNANEIIVATDSDREGENIAWSIMRQAGVDLANKNLKRLWINSLEVSAIRAGFNDLNNGWDYYDIFQEAQAREIGDWLVGMNASPLFSLSLQNLGVKGTYSVGRVQTPTLYMIYDRQKKIADFKPEPYQVLQAHVIAQKGEFVGELDPKQRFKDQVERDEFVQKNNLVLGEQQGMIESVDTQAKQTPSPRLFSLSSLQAKASRLFHASAAETLEVVQSLYERKFLTYPRTDCQFITEKEFAYLQDNLAHYQYLLDEQVELKPKAANKRYVNGAKVQEHTAIVLTRNTPTKQQLLEMSVLEKNIYLLVLRTTLGMFAKPYQYDETVILTKVGQVLFKTIGKVETQAGWQALYAKQDQQKQEKDLLPQVVKGETVQVDVQALDRMTEPPKAYTEGTLITSMKTAGKTLDEDEAEVLKSVQGIGTEATRANIIQRLKDKKYLVTQKNKLVVTESGVTLCEAAEVQPLLTSAEMTAKWELALSQVGQGQRKPENFIGQIKSFVVNLIAKVPGQLAHSSTLRSAVKQQQQAQAKPEEKDNLGLCPHCHKGHIVDKGSFYGCTEFRGAEPCKFTLPKKWSSKKLPKSAIKDLVTKGQTRELQGFYSKRTEKKFSAKLALKDEQIKFVFEQQAHKKKRPKRRQKRSYQRK